MKIAIIREKLYKRHSLIHSCVLCTMLRLDELPHTALHEICLNLDVQAISSFEHTSQKCFNHIRANRLHYSKHAILCMTIELDKNGKRVISVTYEKNPGNYASKILDDSLTLHDQIKSMNPEHFTSYDHEELANMSPLWWRGRTIVTLHDVVDIQRYLPHFNWFTQIALTSRYPINLTDILAAKTKKNLECFGLFGIAGMHCTDDDFRKLGRISKNMRSLRLITPTESSNISKDAILDMLEIGSFFPYFSVELPLVLGNFEECAKKRSWVMKYDKNYELYHSITTSTGATISIIFE